MASDRDHQSRRDTERAGYETLRQQGVTPDAARHIARDASEQVHRNVDRTHTDTPSPKRR
jgi:hypothetical protein